MIPGMDILQVALGAIAPAQEPPMLAEFLSQASNASGVDVSVYAEPVPIVASVQAVGRARYQSLGLDFGKKYVMVYTSHPVRTIERDVNGDKLHYGPDVYLCESDTDWSQQDGWRAVLCVRVAS